MGRYRFNSETEGIVRFQDLSNLPDISDLNQYVKKDEFEQVMNDNELVISAALNDLERRKLDEEIDPNISFLTEEEILNVLEHF